MDGIFASVRNGLTAAVARTRKMQITGLSLLMVRTLILLIILAILLYMYGWLYKLMYQKIADLLAMNELLKTLTGTSFIAAIAFFGKALTDEDGDGKSDYFQNGKKEEDK